MLRKTLASIVVIVLIAVTLVALIYYEPGIFNIQSNSILAVSNVNLAPQGSETVSGRWTGSYWTILATTDMVDQYDAIKFSNATTTSANKIGTFTVDPTATIEIRITPQQPYWTRSLNVAGWNVYPQVQTYQENKITAQATWTTQAVAPKMDVSVWTWGQSYWTAHTPFTITVIKNGVQWASQSYDNTGISQTYTITNPSNTKEWISLKNIGLLGSGYGQPTGPIDNIAILSSSAIFPYSDALLNCIKYSGGDYSYANYWFGGGNYYKYQGYVVQKAPDGSPGLFVRMENTNEAIGDRAFPGEYRSDDTWNAKVLPLPADEWVDKPVALSTSNGLCLNNYLTNVRGYTPLTNSQMNVYGSGWSITNTATAGSDGYAGYVKEMMPTKGMSSLITIQISTDLADAIVERTPVSNGKITSMNWLGQAAGVSASIGDASTLYVNVRQDSTVTSTIDLYATATAGVNIFLNPSSQGINLAPGASQQVAIQVLNNGAPTDQPFTITVTLKDELGDVTSTSSISGTLLQKGVGNTQLTVYTEDATTNQLISGIPVTVGWETNSQLETSGSQGQGAFTIDLAGYTGTVNLVSTETSLYQSATLTVSIGAGINTATLLIYPIGTTSPGGLSWTLILLIVGIIAAVCVIVGLAVYVKKHSRHRRR